MRNAVDLYRAEARAAGETFPGDAVILGVDPSCAATGLALPDGTFAVIRPKVRPGANDAGARARRLDEIDRGLATCLDGAPGLDLAVVEAYALGGRRGYASAYLAEVGGLIRLHLWRAGACLLEVPPSVLKKYATGSGDATKKHMRDAALLDLRHTVRRPVAEPRTPDEADAYWLRRLGLDLVDPFTEPELVPGLARIRRQVRATYAEVHPCSPP
jgi:crossover junction endodeoxyribonuclease RuvC